MTTRNIFTGTVAGFKNIFHVLDVLFISRLISFAKILKNESEL